MFFLLILRATPPARTAGLRQVQAAFPDAKLHLLHVDDGTKTHYAVKQQMQAFAERTGLRNGTHRGY